MVNLNEKVWDQRFSSLTHIREIVKEEKDSLELLPNDNYFDVCLC